MIKQNHQKQDLTALMWIHTFISFAVVAVLLFFFGCKEIQKEKATLGTVAEKASVDSALSDAQGNAHPFTIKKGEGALYDYTYEIEGSPPTRYGQTSLQVLSREDLEVDGVRYMRIRLIGKQFDPDTGETAEGSFPVIFHEDGYIVQSNGVDETQATAAINEFSLRAADSDVILTPNKLLPMNDETEIIRETYHDLKVNLIRMAPPIAVSSRDNCGGVPNCELRVYRITYDRAFWTSEKDFIKVTFEHDISLDPPYLGLFIRECTAMQEQVENRRYFIRRCRKLENFLYE